MAALRLFLVATAFAVIFIGCSSTPEEATTAPPVSGYTYEPNVELSSLHVSSVGNEFTAQVPKGWRSASVDETTSDILLWLVDDDYTASITFMPLQMDPALYSILKRDGLSAVTKVSMSLKEGNVDNPFQVVRSPEEFTLNGKTFYAYEYTVNNKLTVVRVVVFDTGTEFLECACVPAAEQLSPAKQRALFETQQTILASLKVN